MVPEAERMKRCKAAKVLLPVPFVLETVLAGTTGQRTGAVLQRHARDGRVRSEGNVRIGVGVRGRKWCVAPPWRQ